MSWNGPTRRDGVHVAPLDVAAAEIGWMICRPDGTIAFSHCPCCDRAMQSERAAKLVADVVLPLLPEAA